MHFCFIINFVLSYTIIVCSKFSEVILFSVSLFPHKSIIVTFVRGVMEVWAIIVCSKFNE